MEEEEKWLLFSLFWILFGIWFISTGVAQRDATDQSIGASWLFVGFFELLERIIYGPENIAALKRKEWTIIAVIRISVGAIVVVVGYLAMGPWGIFAGFVTARIIIHVIVGILFF